MEYLMTYGWAILIIAIVLIALFQLGILGGSNTPRVQAGACEVLHTSAGSNNEGECQGVWPQFVAQFNGASTISTASIAETSYGTFTFWIYLSSPVPSEAGLVGYYDGGMDVATDISLDPYIQTHWSTLSKASIPMSINRWTFVTGTWSKSGGNIVLQMYVNGASSGTPATYTGGMSGSSTVFMDKGQYADTFNGMLANVQIYNTSLSANEINALYLEGIGGAPVDPNHIVGWWPLNGNAQDYSGNNNNGQATAVSYTSQWTSGYTQP